MQPHAQAYAYCTYCPKMCSFSCPVSEASKSESHSPWGKMSAAQLVNVGQRALDEGSSQALHACTGCGRCQDVCRHNNDVPAALFAARSESIARGVQPRGASSTLATFAQAQNPFGRQLAELVARWRAETPIRYPLFPGCSSLVKQPEVVEDALAVSQAFGAPMGVVRAASRCCGYPLYAAGAHDLFLAHARSMVEALAPYPEMAVLDPGCAFTLKVVYPRFGVKLSTRIRTVTEILAENLPHAPQVPALNETVGYHDACHLGRGLSEYEPPRELLRRAVSQLLEAPAHHEEGGCAGGGGLLPRTMPEISVEVARRQANEVAGGGEAVVTACGTSGRMFARAGRRSEHVVTILRRWLNQASKENA